jgi:hypothetical protein
MVIACCQSTNRLLSRRRNFFVEETLPSVHLDGFDRRQNLLGQLDPLVRLFARLQTKRCRHFPNNH